MRKVNSNLTEVHGSPAKLSKYADKNAVATSWMMAQARGYMDNGMDPSTFNRPRNGPRCSR